MQDFFEHDDEGITTALREFVGGIKELDAAAAEINGKLRSLYRRASEFGFNSKILKTIARQKRDGQAENEANEQISYFESLGGDKAASRLRDGASFAEVAFGSATGFACDDLDTL